MKIRQYTIFRNGRRIFKNLSESEYNEIMEDFKIEYYQLGFPKPNEIETQVYEIEDIINGN